MDKNIKKLKRILKVLDVLCGSFFQYIIPLIMIILVFGIFILIVLLFIFNSPILQNEAFIPICVFSVLFSLIIVGLKDKLKDFLHIKADLLAIDLTTRKYEEAVKQLVSECKNLGYKKGRKNGLPIFELNSIN